MTDPFTVWDRWTVLVFVAVLFAFISLGDLTEPKKIQVHNKMDTILKPGVQILEKVTSKCREIELKETQIYKHTDPHSTHTHTHTKDKQWSLLNIHTCERTWNLKTSHKVLSPESVILSDLSSV